MCRKMQLLFYVGMEFKVRVIRKVNNYVERLEIWKGSQNNELFSMGF